MIHFKIVTPERVVVETEVDSVTLPTTMGEITVLPHHVPLVSDLVAGELRFKKGHEEEFFAVSSGFIEIKKNNEVVVLADTAEFGHEIDLDRAHEAAQKARDLMKSVAAAEHPLPASAILQKNLARIKVAHKHRSKKH